ncbi:MAG: serine hydroxymethyltransferase [Candidatus Ryanbacteria bacterium RIFCSPLOWO2_01_FULL_48_26]|uniref:Serine hydroxymethyltransferase n=1 Tax=Candidatus Ryanbacteria bacterium RIFCSPLOWO2_01_FULL_48_26 TaxID=1802126 RepID=A0A1G2GQW1_9BACT|nr:MAG: serine hydroxymethyltransferase [Candidatus Ryanbacteria bacterium RIFCSPLOWO2_01_FULL_48_26]
MKDKLIQKLIKDEVRRQGETINLIASENYVSNDVLTALGSELTNKYSEGYPHKRYYGGQTYTDQIEDECKKRALTLFGLKNNIWAVNAQALSGSPANVAVYLGLVPIGEKIMGMSLPHGGHLTHGQKVSMSGKAWTQVPFGVDEKTEVIDYTEVKKIAIQEKPALIVAGFTAYPRIVDFKKFREVADACGAILMVDMSHFAGLVAGKAYPSPFPYADVVTTTTHKTLRGPRAALIFSRLDKKRIAQNGKEQTFPECIDKAIFPGLQGGPHMNQIAAVAVALKEAATPAFKKYAAQIIRNARVLASELHALGWKIISGGTDSHLILMDTWMNGTGMSGAEASGKLETMGIIVNKNTIPGETRSAFDPSGIRLGTAALTSRGMNEREMKLVAQLIHAILAEKKNASREVKSLCKKFPLWYKS